MGCSFEGVGDWVWGERDLVVSILRVSALYVGHFQVVF